jgi:hypothetical protein
MPSPFMSWPPKHAIHAKTIFWSQQRDKPYLKAYRPTDYLEQANHDAGKYLQSITPSTRHELCRYR